MKRNDQPDFTKVLARQLCARVMAVALLLSLLMLPLHAIAGQLWSDTPPSPSIMKELERYKAGSSPEERAAAVARLELLGESEPEAWNQLGIEYRLGKPASPQLAEAMFVKAAAAKNLNGLMNVIAVRIGDGRIAESCKAAEAGSAWPNGSGAPAIAYLGECYRLGRNGPKDAVKAEPLLMEACRWGWEPACDSALASLQSNPTPARKMAYRNYLEKLNAAQYMPAISALGIDASESSFESERLWGETLLQKASAAGYGEACTALALVLWRKGDASAMGKIDGLLDCGIADKRAPELAWLFRGVFAALSGDEKAGRTSIERSFAEGLKQAGAFSVAFGYPVPTGADPTQCAPFCDWIGVIQEAGRIQQLQLDEQNRQTEIERVAREMAEREAMELAAQAAAQQAEYNAQMAAQNAEARRERRRRFWSGVLTVAVVLATGYVQAQADAYARPSPPRPVYQPPAISAPYRPIYQPPVTYAPTSTSTSGQTKICYVETSRGTQAITVNYSQACPMRIQPGATSIKPTSTGHLVGESVDGMVRNCIYEGPAGRSARSVSASGMCPLTH